MILKYTTSDGITVEITEEEGGKVYLTNEMTQHKYLVVFDPAIDFIFEVYLK